jgi:hypothetical protein
LLLFILDGSDMGDRMNRYGQWGGTCAENIQYGRPKSGMDIIIQLLIDDGVASRGHRNNIFSKSSNITGIGLADHPTWKGVCVLDYAGSYSAGSGDIVDTSGSSLPDYTPPPPKKDYTPEETKELDDGYVDFDDLPSVIQAQLGGFDLGDDYKIKKVGNQYSIEYCPSKKKAKYNNRKIQRQTTMGGDEWYGK